MDEAQTFCKTLKEGYYCEGHRSKVNLKVSLMGLLLEKLGQVFTKCYHFLVSPTDECYRAGKPFVGYSSLRLQTREMCSAKMTQELA